MAAITLHGITKSFGRDAVLKGIGLDVVDGEFLTLVGPSGCGKSTLLRIIAGLEPQDAGDVLIDGRNVNDVRPSRRDLAMVFQSYALYPHLSVEDNLLTPLRLRDLSAAERLPLLGLLLPGRRAKLARARALVRDTARSLQIEDLLARKPGQLSGGQRQRVALGRAVVRQPVAFLMDEPLSNLDAALRVHTRAELAELHRSLRTTFVYVTHDQAEALTMSSRVAVMMAGAVLQLGTPEEVYGDPADLRVAGFIGSPKINALKGEIDGRGRVTAHGLTLTRRIDAPPGPVTVGLRPEHLDVAAGDAGEGLSGRLVLKENVGADVYLHLAVADGAARIVVRTRPQTAAGLALGAAVGVTRVPGAALVFGADGGRLRFAGRAPVLAA